MKHKVMNIRPQEVTENGERTVRYKGSDGKFHNIAAGSQGSQQGSTPTDAQTEQSVVVGSVTIVNDKPTITVDELMADRLQDRLGQRRLPYRHLDGDGRDSRDSTG